MIARACPIRLFDMPKDSGCEMRVEFCREPFRVIDMRDMQGLPAIFDMTTASVSFPAPLPPRNTNATPGLRPGFCTMSASHPLTYSKVCRSPEQITFLDMTHD